MMSLLFFCILDNHLHDTYSKSITIRWTDLFLFFPLSLLLFNFYLDLGNFVLYRRIVEELLRLADDTSGAADIDVVRPFKAHWLIGIIIQLVDYL